MNSIALVRPAPSATKSSTPHVPWPVALTSIAGFWLLYFVLNTLRAVAQGAPDQWDMAGRRAVVTLAGTALTGLFCLVLRRIDHKSIATLLTTAFLAAIPVSFAYAALNYAAFSAIHPVDSVQREIEHHPDGMYGGPAAEIASGATEWYFFIVSWAVLYIALSYAYEVRHAERLAAASRAEAQTAQLRALRYQINPHFLFNTLNSLSTLVLRQNGDEAERMIINLSHFLRASVTADATEDVSLADEIRLQRLYLDIERIRFPDRLNLVFDIPAEVEYAPVPALILQPLVENAIKHGVARSQNPVTISVRARRDDVRLRVIVENDGDRFRAADLAGAAAIQGTGLGLRNVSDRLHARFGDGARCVYGPRPEGGFRVALTMPLPRHG
jgi:signal transduction histidine kinase